MKWVIPTQMRIIVYVILALLVLVVAIITDAPAQGQSSTNLLSPQPSKFMITSFVAQSQNQSFELVPAPLPGNDLLTIKRPLLGGMIGGKVFG
jgi:hypothetical protein